MLKHYYNEFDPRAAAMLRQMMDDGLLPPGDVDERSITEVHPDDIKGYTQFHFFAGIGGWQYALQIAGWPADVPVWTGSCPCQPFSTAGRHKGKEDERHLWPAWEGLIRECKPPVIFGEQVATAITKGWLDDVYEMLEAKGYAVGAAVLPASSVGAPHKRDRLWFVGHAEHNGQSATPQQRSDGKALQRAPEGKDITFQPSRAGDTSDVANSNVERLEGYNGFQKEEEGRQQPDGHSAEGHWDDVVWVGCPDGKARPIEPSIPLLADGFQHRKPILHAIGNAIVPQVAAEFIGAYMEVINDRH